MRKIILLTTLGLTVACVGTAFADETRGRRDHNERPGHSRTHDETAEHANCPVHAAHRSKNAERRVGDNDSHHDRQTPATSTRASKRM